MTAEEPEISASCIAVPCPPFETIDVGPLIASAPVGHLLVDGIMLEDHTDEAPCPGCRGVKHGGGSRDGMG